MTGSSRKKHTPLPVAAEVTWAVYLILLAVLTVTEALVRSEIGLFARLLDVLVLVTALPGCIVAWVFSAYFLLRRAELENIFYCAARIAAGWCLGPILGWGVVCGLNSLLEGDIDGGLLLFYLPLLAVLMPVFVLPPVMIVWRAKTRRRLNQAQEH